MKAGKQKVNQLTAKPFPLTVGREACCIFYSLGQKSAQYGMDAESIFHKAPKRLFPERKEMAWWWQLQGLQEQAMKSLVAETAFLGDLTAWTSIAFC